MKFAETLRELLGKACPAPWVVDPDDRRDMEHNNHILYGPELHTVCFMAWSGDKRNNVQHEAAAELIAFLRNHADALLRVVEAAADMEKEWSFDHAKKLREALRSLDGDTSAHGMRDKR